MKFFRSGWFHLLLTSWALMNRLPAQVGPLVSPVTAQTVSSDPQQKNEPTVPSDTNGAATAGDLVTATKWGFVIPGVVNLEELSGTGVLFGAAASQGYGWLQGGTSTNNEEGYLSVVQPYAALFQTGHRHKFLLEYSPTVDLYNRHQWDGNVLQRGSIKGFNLLSERWSWNYSIFGTYGLEYLRELSGFAVGEYPGWLTFSVPSDTRLLASASTGLSFRRKPRQEFSFILNDAYSAVIQGPHYDVGSARVQATDYFGRNSNWYTYAQAHRYTDQPGCTRIGAGGGFAWNASSSTTLSLEAGPEYGSGRCVERLTGTFSGTLAQHLFSPRTVLYLRATRDLAEPYLLQNSWTDVFSAKLWQKTSQSTNFDAGAAYVRGSSLPGESVSRYRGFLAFSEFRWRLSNSFDFVGSYRYFKRDLTNPGFDDRHSWVFGSIVWHPLFRGMGRSN